jgi:hypothetical protein
MAYFLHILTIINVYIVIAISLNPITRQFVFTAFPWLKCKQP